MLSITLRQLEYATAVARHGGITTAAEALHVSQPALSVAIAQLEAHLGKPLFLRRSGGPITPTSFGRMFLEDAAQQLTALTRLAAGDTGQALPVRLACFEDLAPVLLAPLLRHLGHVLPAVPIQPHVLGFDPLTRALHSGQIDLAVTYDLGLSDGIARSTLTRLAPHAVLPADHPLASKPALTLRDLADQPLILTDQGLSLGHMRALFAQQGMEPVIAHRTATLDLLRSFAANGFGIGLSYTCPAPTHSPDGRPIALRPILDAGSEPVVLVHLRANPLAASAGLVVTAIAAMPALLPFPSAPTSMAPDAMRESP